MADHASHRQPSCRRLAVVVITFVPIRVGDNGLPSDFIEGDLLRAVPRRGGDRDGSRHRIGVRHSPFQRLHPAHGSTRDGEQPRNPQMIDEHLLQPNHVPRRDYGKLQRVRTARSRIDRGGTRRAAASAQDVRAQHEVFVGVEGLAGTDHVVPPSGLAALMANTGGVRIAGKGVTNEDRV